MGDKLERFVLENRDQFDDEMPSAQVWVNIAKKKQKKPVLIYWKVAAILLMISTLYLIVDRHFGDEGAVQMSVNESPEFQSVESYYVQLISQKRKQISTSQDARLKHEFLAELELLDHKYNELKQTYQYQNSSEILTDALINNLKLRLDLLNQQLNILEALQNQKGNEIPTSEI